MSLSGRVMARTKHVPGQDELKLLAELEFRRDFERESDARMRQLVREAHAEGATIESLSSTSGWGTSKVKRILRD